MPAISSQAPCSTVGHFQLLESPFFFLSSLSLCDCHVVIFVYIDTMCVSIHAQSVSSHPHRKRMCPTSRNLSYRNTSTRVQQRSVQRCSLGNCNIAVLGTGTFQSKLECPCRGDSCIKGETARNDLKHSSTWKHLICSVSEREGSRPFWSHILSSLSSLFLLPLAQATELHGEGNQVRRPSGASIWSLCCLSHLLCSC